MTTENPTEIWRDVPGYEGLYSVSNFGEIRSLDRILPYGEKAFRHHRGRVLQTVTQNRGYQRVALCRDGVREDFLVHWLVAAAFLGPRPEGEVVRHLDDDQTRNHLENLAYGTQSQNQYDAVGNGRSHHNSRITCKRGHLLSGSNLYFKPDYPVRRQCRSCVRAFAWHGNHGVEKTPESLQTVSDRFYSETVEVAA